MNSLTPESSPVSLWENEFQEAPNVSLSSKFCHGEYVGMLNCELATINTVTMFTELITMFKNILLAKVDA